MVKLDNGAVVWAKLGSYPPWPSRIVSFALLSKELKKELGNTPGASKHELVWFFGSHNYAWVPINCIWSYDDGYEEKAFNKKERARKGFQLALSEANDWITKNGNTELMPLESKLKKKDSESISSPSEKDTPRKRGRPRKSLSKQDEESESDSEKDQKSKTKNDSESEEEDITNKKQEAIHPKKRGRKKKEESSDEKEKKQNGEDERTREQSSKSPRQDSSSPKKRRSNKEDSERETKKSKVDTSNIITDNGHEEMPELLSDEQVPKVEIHPSPSPSGKPKVNAASIANAIRLLSRHPVAKYFKYTILNYSEGLASARATYSDARQGNPYEVHACVGAGYYLMDITSYIAALHSLHEGESAVTQDFHSSVLIPIPQGSEITIKSKLLPSKHPQLIFLNAEIFLGSKLAMTATITKSLATVEVTPLSISSPKDTNTSSSRDATPINTPIKS